MVAKSSAARLLSGNLKMRNFMSTVTAASLKLPFDLSKYPEDTEVRKIRETMLDRLKIPRDPVPSVELSQVKTKGFVSLNYAGGVIISKFITWIEQPAQAGPLNDSFPQIIGTKGKTLEELATAVIYTYHPERQRYLAVRVDIYSSSYGPVSLGEFRVDEMANEVATFCHDEFIKI